MNEYQYIIDAFTKTGENTNLEVNNLNASCITSKNNNFELDSEGNLTVKSINAQTVNIVSQILLDSIHPVGSVYISVDSTNPSQLFGGQWEQIKDTFLLACGDNYANGSQGGSSTNTHDHFRGGDGGNISTVANVPGSYVIGNKNNVSSTTISIMPPYLAVYMWKRVS